MVGFGAEFGRVIPFKTARLTLVSDADRTPARLGTVPLAFREWRGELEQRAPRFRRPAWVAAAAIHAVIGAAIILYASLTPLPEPLPVVAVTLSFEASKPTAEPGPTPTTETPPAEAPLAEASPTVPAPPADAVPEPSADIAAKAEMPQAPPPPEPLPVETPPPAPEPPLAAAPEPPKPVEVAMAPPPPSPRPAPPPRRTAPPPAKHPAPARPQAAAPGDSDTPPAPSLSTGAPPMVEEMAAAPIIPPSPVGAAAGNPKPNYPAAARSAHLEGRLVLRVDVTVSGSAETVVVAVSSGHPILDQAALDAVQAWRFNPATRGGMAVSGIIYQPIQFLID